MEAGSLQAASGEKKPAFRRTHFILDRNYQLRHTIGLSLVSLLISAGFGFVMYRVHLENTALLKVTPEFLPLVREADHDTLVLIVASSIGIAVAMVFVGIWATHRIAGPLWVIAHYMDILGQGRFPRIRELRKGDQLREFFDRFRHAVDGMRQLSADEAVELEAIARQLATDPSAAEARLRAMAAARRHKAEELVERPRLDQLPHG